MTQPETFHSSLTATRAAVKKQLWGFVAALALVLVGAGLLTTVQLAQLNQDLSKQAAPATSISLAALENPVKVDQVFTVAVMVNTNSNVVKALDIGLTYEPTLLQLQDVTKGAWLPQAEIAVKKLDQTNGKALIGLVIPPTASPNFATGQGVAAIATFKALKTDPKATVSFSAPETVAGAANEAQNVISNYSDVSFAIIEKDQTASGNLVIYSYEACIYQGSNGHSLYMLWRPDTYPSATMVEVSETSNFSSYGDKSIVGAKVQTDGWSITDGTNFRKGNEFFNFNPDVTYYFRLKYDGDKRSGVVAFKPTACAGTGGVNYQQCNQNCNANSDCGTNLVCSGNKCRRDGNTGDDKCLMPPDKGIKRACNEYCSDSSECGSGLTCWYNQCRNPKDTTIATCKLPLAPGQVDGCNRYCADSSECSSGLTCWYNQCRLASNQQSDKCQAPKAAVTSSSNTANKGGVVTDNTTGSTKPTAVPTAIKVVIKGTVEKAVTASPTATRPTAAVVISAKPTVKAVATVKPTAGVTSKKVSSSFGWVPGALGVILLVVIGLIAWPQIRAAMNPPKAKVVPPQQPPQR